MKKLAFISAVLLAVAMFRVADDLPAWADPHAPVHTATSATHYVKHAFDDTSVPNMVTAVLADYRGYDTMFETVVIFIAGLGIMAILGMSGDWKNPEDNRNEDYDIILHFTARYLIPPAQLFAFYVVAHGHHSPGGGFQGGVILGSTFIVLALSRELPHALKIITPVRMITLAAAGVLIYSGVGLLCLILGYNFLDYSALQMVLPLDSVEARSFSMLLVEIGVAFTVSAVIFSIYAHLSTGGELKEGL